MDMARLKSDGTVEGTAAPAAPEERAIAGEESWWVGQTTGTAGVHVSERTALSLTPVLATHNTIATDVAVMPLDISQRSEGKGRRHAREHVNHELLRRSPDRGRSVPITWKQALMGHALSRGNGYAEVQRTGRGRPYALHLLDPDRTRAEEDKATGEFGYRHGNDWLPASDVLHIAGFGFDGGSGDNFTRLIAQAIGLGLAGESYSAEYFENGAEAGGVVELPGAFKSIAEMEEYRKGIERRHQGQGNRHKIAILQREGKWKNTGTDPEKSQLVESRRFQTLDVIRPWRLPPNKAGDYSQANLSNIDGANLDYLMTALLGWLVAIEQQFDLKLLTRAEWMDGYYHRHNLKSLLRGDIKTRYAAYEIAVRNGWYSRDEVREMEEENPIGEGLGGDFYTIQAQVTKLDQAGIAFQPQQQPAETKPPDAGGDFDQ